MSKAKRNKKLIKDIEILINEYDVANYFVGFNQTNKSEIDNNFIKILKNLINGDKQKQNR